jgi:hypothetical protein
MDHRFVEFVPDCLDEGVLYISMPYATAVHRCACGCGHQVVTPLSPTDWSLTFDGETVSLDPSIGNWSFPCKSHYWIWGGNVIWSNAWTPRKILASRKWAAADKRRFYERRHRED